MSFSIEHEIHILVNRHETVEAATPDVIQLLESEHHSWSEEDCQSVWIFLLRTGQAQVLVDVVLRRLKDKKFSVPWGHLLEAFHQLYHSLEPEVWPLILKGIEQKKGQFSAAQCCSWDSQHPELPQWRNELRWEKQKNPALRKKESLEELHLLRTQQLYAAEDKLLEKMLKMFPGDPEIIREKKTSQERRAEEIFQRHLGARSRGPRSVDGGKTFPSSELNFVEPEEVIALQALSQSLLDQTQNVDLNQSSQLRMDLAVVAWMIEDFETCRQILLQTETSPGSMWLMAEVLLKTNRYLDLLNLLREIENLYFSDPETFFATALFRAQALYGLGQKHSALEVLESLLASRPSYRTAPVLLNLWRGS